MKSMFSGCKLTRLDLSNFNTENVSDMTNMFSDCSSLRSLVLSSFNTHNVTNMRFMFSECWNLTNLDLSSFYTENVVDMCYMFYRCRRITDLNLSHFDMGNVTYKSHMCDELSIPSTSGICTITCPAAVQTELESGTSLPTSGVTFTWLRPTSK